MIILLMNRIVNCYWFIILLSCVCNLKDVLTNVPTSVYLKYKGKYTSDVKNFEVVVPQRVNKDGNFISHVVSHHHSKRSIDEMDFIFYKIPIGGKDYLVELTPNRRLISPGAVVEIHKDVRSSDRTFLKDSSNNETLGQMFRNLDIKKLENTECHFYGHVKGESISKVALSTCYGLAGFIQIEEELYTIEPVAEHNHFSEDAYPHILYKADGSENSSVCHTIGELTVSVVDQIIRKRRESNNVLSLPMFIETLVVMDKTLISHHQDSDCENYVLTVFNMAFNLFQDASSGLLMTLTIVRIIRLEVENNEMNLRVNADAEKTLRYFQTWQYEINPGDDSHPNHHDIAVLITRVNVCYSPSLCGLLGLTTIGKACDPKLSAALCEDNGLRLGYVIAHEIGHLLGADHDSGNSTCNGTDPDGLKTVMHPHIPPTAQTWSSCSQAYFKAFLSSGLGNCLLDEPEEHHFNVQDLLPGVMYNADFQCKYLISVNARECDIGSTCESLNCYVPGYACIITHTRPADGTHCGENMWCHNTKCLVLGERPGAVDGNWGEWSSWSDCSRTCGSGVASATRNCDKPHPSHGGKNCVGERKRYKICAATITTVPQNISDLIRFISEEVNVSFVGKPCETGRPSFRDIQCGEFDDWIYPEDGKVHKWKAYFLHDDNPCILYCVNEQKQVAALKPRVVDGTMCYRGIRDICIGGTCRTLPCDLHFESNAVEDACGVCHGDGTGCEYSEGIETFSKLVKGLTKLINVPVGARNIKVHVTLPSSARIIVKDKDTRDTYIRGKSLGMFNVPGSQAWLGMIRKNQEALHIPGPVTKPLSVWIQRLDNVTVKWSMGLPAEQQRKPEFAWDFLKWEPCSAKCGPGTQKSKPSCMEEKAGWVEDTFCADLVMPPTKARQCEVAKCEPRWMVGDWKDCSPPNCPKKERKRVVYCIKPIGEGEGESQIVSDSECTKPKPHESECCENRHKREDTKYSVDNFFMLYPKFGANMPEFSFRRRHDDYTYGNFQRLPKNTTNLKYFATFSVPQKNNEAVPLSLMYSPRSKDYFHIRAIPEDSKPDLESETNVSSSNRTTNNAQTEHKASSGFHKEIFRKEKIGINYVQSVSDESSAVKSRKNSAKLNGSRSQSKNSTVRFYMNLKKICKRTKYRQNDLKRCYGTKRRSRLRLRRNRKNLSKNRNIKLKLFQKKNNKKKFNYTSPNLVFENFQDNKKYRVAKLLNIESPRKYSLLERAKLKSQQSNAFSTRDHHRKLNCSFLSFFSENHAKSKKEFESTTRGTEFRLIRSNCKEFGGSGLKKLSLAGENFQRKINNMQDIMKEEKSFYANPFEPVTRIEKSDLHSKKGFKDKHSSLDILFSEKRNKSYQWKKKHPKGKRTTKSCLYKIKRSSRIWKKPKSKDVNAKPGKEQCRGMCGIETRNYLNNLFRDSHPKIFTAKPTQTNKPQEQKNQFKSPVIKEGTLVIDKDSVENQKMEIMFDDDETGEKRKKYLKLPQPASNEKKLTLTGRDVFDLLKVLQLGDDFYKSGALWPLRIKLEFFSFYTSIERFYTNMHVTGKASSEGNVEMNIRKPENSTEASENEKNTKSSEMITVTETTTTSKNIKSAVSTIGQLSSTREGAKFSETTTPRSENATSKVSSRQSSTIISETQTTTVSTSESYSGENDFDVDDVVLENLISSTEASNKSKKKKKKKMETNEDNYEDSGSSDKLTEGRSARYYML